MKKLIIAMALALSAGSVCAIEAGELAVLAIKDALAEARVSLAGAPKVPADKAIAVLPVSGDADGNVVGMLKNILVDAGKKCVEGKEDPMWNAILKEIEWDERKEDILDPATLDKFGKLKSAQYLMYGSIRRLAASERYVLVELELHISCVATKEHVWGGTFVRRHHAPGNDPEGRTEIPDEVRAALNDGIRAEMAKSLEASKKLVGVKKVAMLPIAGDIDQYAAGLFRDVLSASSSVTPVNLDVTTRAEARFALREGPGRADAIAYGALRDIGAVIVYENWYGKKTCRARMELQLWIENGSTREILWSDTIRYTKEFEVFNGFSAIVWALMGIGAVLIALFIVSRFCTRVR